MILKSVRLKNFKCYENHSQDFELGITSICGENGAGKSSLLEAISWALFNFLPYSSNSRIIKHGKKSAEVELIIKSSLNAREYMIKRRTQGLTSVYDMNYKQVVAEGVGNVQDWIKHELGLRQSDNLAAICKNGIATPQGSLALDFTETPENRRKIFDTLLGFDEYKVLNISLAEALKLLKEEVQGLKVEMARFENVEVEIPSLEKELEIKQIELNNLKPILINFNNTLNSIKTEFDLAKNTQQNYQNISKELEKLNIEIIDLTSELKDLEIKQKRELDLRNEAENYIKIKVQKKEFDLQKKEFDLQKNKNIQLSQALELEKENIIKTEKALTELKDLKNEYENLKDKAETYTKLLKEEKVLIQRKSQLKAELEQEERIKTDTIKLNLESQESEINIKSILETENNIKQIPALEEELEKLRFEFNEVNNLEKQINKLIKPENLDANTQSENELKENYKQSLENLIKEEKYQSQLLAQAELNESLIPKLSESGICPLLLEPCLNLKSKAKIGQNLVEVQKKEIETNLNQTNNKINTLKIQIESSEKLINYLNTFGQIQENIKNRNSLALKDAGVKLREKLDQLKIQKNNFENIPKLKIKLQDIQNKIDNNKSVLSKIELSKIELIELENKSINLHNEIISLKEQADRALILKSELEKENLFENILQNQKYKITDLEKELLNINQILESLKEIPEKLIAIEHELETLEKIYLEWIKLKEALENLIKLENKRTLLEEKTKELINQKTDLELNLKDENYFIQTTELIKEKQNLINYNTGQIHSLEYLTKNLTDRINDLKEKQKTFEKYKTDLEVQKNKENKITKMRAYFKELSIRLAKEYTAKISQRATNLFREIMQDSSFELTWSEDYEIITYKNGQKLTFDLLSGGQQVSAAISIRLSLLQELSNISFAFFDEPTAHLDTERRNQLALQIASIKSFSQLFVITHDESFASQANTVINI